ncbi:MAG TPA: Clp protease ClpP, partial [Nevskiaceae bacterium]|nr:Clp protease ClpP [Nevskiaceae bacterium]
AKSGTTVITRNEGVAASSASLIFMAGDQREMFANTLLMIHAPWQMAMGNSADLREMADVLDTYAQAMATSYARASGRSVADELAQLTDGKDHWFSAADALTAHYATQVTDAEPPQEESDAQGMPRHQPVVGALTRYRSAPATACASYQPHLRAALKTARATVPPAAPAASHPRSVSMNLKQIARALGIKIAANATDDQIRASIATKLGLAAGATDDQISAALESYDPPTQAEPAAQLNAQQQREQEITAMFAVALAHQPENRELQQMRACALIGDAPVATVRKDLLAKLAAGEPAGGTYVPSVQAGADQRDKRRAAAVNWLLVRGTIAKRDSEAVRDLGANPFKGMSISDMARACLEDIGFKVAGRNRHDLISAAITQSTSDFPNIFENALHKTLLAGFTVAPTTWDKICRIGTLTDFRPHIRYRASSIGNLQVRLENGEYKTIALNDAERETIQAQARGGIINVSREMLVNDDMGVFTDLTMQLGRSASRTREAAFYTALTSNGGLGPTMGDGKTLYHADHGNISAAAGVPSVAAFDADRVKMGSQKDPGGNDFIDVRPSIWLGPLSLGGDVRVINSAQYDPDTANKLQKPNKARGIYDLVIDTPRLTGAPWYSFADPQAEPVFEFGFLDGQQQPQLAMEESFTQHGMKWRVVDEWGVAAIGWRGSVRNAGA